MAWRVTDDEVREVVKTNSQVSVVPFIAAANALTDYVVSEDSDGVLTTALKKQIELYLAAHFYAIRDQQYAEKATDAARARFQVGQSGLKPFELNDWGRTAMALDVTQTLKKLNRNEPAKASLDWLGKPVSEQTDLEDRD